MTNPALLILEDGTVFRGKSIGVDGMSSGEVVFNTAITGYQEILTDPSYARQLVTLTHPHIGNVGTTDEDRESRGVFCAGLVVKNVPPRHSNWRAQSSLPDYLKDNNVVAISDIDTRKLTRLIRSKGAQNGCIAAGSSPDPKHALAQVKKFPGLGGMDLAEAVSSARAYHWDQGVWHIEHGYQPAPPAQFKVVACDYGIKHNLLRLLAERGCDLTVVPAKTSAEGIVEYQPDGVFLSNGPGDPEPCDYAIDAIGDLLERDIPLFGICLGHQLLALASGGKTTKMKFGHHGANHPVRDLDSGRVLITSQNHGFAVQESSLPAHLRITHRSLFDGTIQGLERRDKPAFSFQGHPEGSPGPHDLGHLFDRFIALMQANRDASKQRQKKTSDDA